MQRHPDGNPAVRATDFGAKLSNHCAFAPRFRDYIKRPHEEMADLLEAAGPTARFQFGEMLWWYFPNSIGMAFYETYTTSRFEAYYGRALHTFLAPNDEPSVNGYVNANFLRRTVKDHVDAIRTYFLATYPNASFELLCRWTSMTRRRAARHSDLQRVVV